MSDLEQKIKSKYKTVAGVDNKIFSECLNFLAESQEGRYVLNRLMARCGTFKPSVMANKDGITDRGAIEYNEGRRSVWVSEIHNFLTPNNLKEVMFFNRRQKCQTQLTEQKKQDNSLQQK